MSNYSPEFEKELKERILAIPKNRWVLHGTSSFRSDNVVVDTYESTESDTGNTHTHSRVKIGGETIYGNCADYIYRELRDRFRQEILEIEQNRIEARQRRELAEKSKQSAEENALLALIPSHTPPGPPVPPSSEVAPPADRPTARRSMDSAVRWMSRVVLAIICLGLAWVFVAVIRSCTK